MKILLISGGHIDTKWADNFVKLYNYDKIIAVDGGLSAANLLNIMPDVAVGDFDTIDEEVLRIYEETESCKIIRLNPMKDDTDTQQAVQIAIDMGADEVHIIGGLGGRIDHLLSNIYMLKMAYEQGVKAIMYDEINKIYVIDGYNNLQRDENYGKYISFIQLETPACDVTMKGFVYDVEKFDFDTSKEYRLGISNEFKNDTAEINIGKGMLVVTEISRG